MKFRIKPFCLIVPTLLIVLLFQGCSTTRKSPLGENPTNEQLKMNINGVEQSVVVRSSNIEHPILLHLHGGPGYPLFPYLDQFRKLEEHFTMVYWEQRGTASSLNSDVDEGSMTTDTLMNDLEQLVVWLKNKYHKKRIFIWGHSWGSNLGLLYASKFPENIYAYVGTGQSTNLIENERMCYHFALENAQNQQNKKALRQLNRIDTLDYQLSDALKVRKWVYTFGGIVHHNNQEKAYINTSVLKKVLKTPEYSFADKWRLITRSKFSGKTLWDDMMELNLFKEVKTVQAPVYFFEGRYDHLVSSALAAKYFHQLDANGQKQLIWFNHSAHRPHIEEPKKFLRKMIMVKKNHY